MQIIFDQKTDVMRIKFQKGKYKISKELGNGIIVDMAEHNKIIAIEILDVSEKIPKKNLKEVTLSLAA